LILNGYFYLGDPRAGRIALPGADAGDFAGNCSHIYPQGKSQGVFPFSGNELAAKDKVGLKSFRQLPDH
jgi:hypothetical protein